jgi:hypothetical protein
MHLPRYAGAEVGVNTVTREVYDTLRRRDIHMEVDAARRLAESW